jgi:hypothetical protein
VTSDAFARAAKNEQQANVPTTSNDFLNDFIMRSQEFQLWNALTRVFVSRPWTFHNLSSRICATNDAETRVAPSNKAQIAPMRHVEFVGQGSVAATES